MHWVSVAEANYWSKPYGSRYAPYLD